MKRLLIIFMIIVAIILIISIMIFCYRVSREREIVNEPLSEHGLLYIKGKVNEYLKNSNVDYVPTKEIAIKIAEAVIGKEEVKEHQPFIARYDDEHKVWMVSGAVYSCRFFRIEAAQGGGPNVLIQRSDGKILVIWHGE